MNNSIDEIFEGVTSLPPEHKFGKWQEYSTHDTENIKGFFGDYRWLSNFQLAPVYWGGLLYPSSENAYQAQKVSPRDRVHFLTCSPNESKRLWKRSDLKRLFSPEGWNDVKLDIMVGIVFQKFHQSKDLRIKLLETGTRYLEETNDWNDQFYGFDYRHGGKNELGKLLIRIRAFYK